MPLSNNPHATQPERVKEGRKTHEPAPARALDGSGGRVELFLEVLDSTKVGLDGLFKRSVMEFPSRAFTLSLGRCEVLPEQGMVDVTWDKRSA